MGAVLRGIVGGVGRDNWFEVVRVETILGNFLADWVISKKSHSVEVRSTGRTVCNERMSI